MKHFQDLGHRVIFLVGSFTALIGDPSGRSKTRPALTQEADRRKRRDVQEAGIQDPGPRQDGDRLQQPVVRGAQFLGLDSALFALHRGTNARARRFYQPDASQSAHLRSTSFLYPLAQAFDSVALKADFELGGTDQKFNLLVGRDIMREYGLEPQVILTTPLLEGTDGVEKMSKSLGNYIGFTEAPEAIYGKVMSISDSLMFRYWELLTEIPTTDLQRMRTEVESGVLHPMTAKGNLARELVAEFHGTRCVTSSGRALRPGPPAG